MWYLHTLCWIKFFFFFTCSWFCIIIYFTLTLGFYFLDKRSRHPVIISRDLHSRLAHVRTSRNNHSSLGGRWGVLVFERRWHLNCSVFTNRQTDTQWTHLWINGLLRHLNYISLWQLLLLIPLDIFPITSVCGYSGFCTSTSCFLFGLEDCSSLD